MPNDNIINNAESNFQWRSKINAKSLESVSVKDYGALGDYTTDDTSSINAAISAAPNGFVFFPHGVYRYTGTLVLPENIKLVGVGAPKIASFPQTGGDKSKLRPGFKDTISGSSIIFDGTGSTQNYTTNRSDKFSSITPMVLYNHHGALSISGIGFIQDMDVLDAGGTLTTISNDNRAATYTAGIVNTSTLSLESDVTVFGYFNDAGYIAHNQDGGNIDPDYQSKTNCLITGGVAIIGQDTTEGAGSEGLTGSRWTACGIYGADHHTREDGLYTVPALYIDGAVVGSGSNTGIRGHSFANCNFRTYANDSISLDNCNDILFTNSVWEFSTLAGVTNADAAGGFVGTSNTKDIIIVGGAGTGDPKLLTFLQQIGGKYQVIGAGAFGNVIIGDGGESIRIAGDLANSDSYIQFTDDISSTVSGWKIKKDGGTANLEFLHDNSLILSLDSSNGIANGFGFKSFGTKTIATGVINIGTGGYYSVDTEASAGTDDLDTITGGVYDGQVVILRAANSSRDVVIKDATGNIKLDSDFTMASVNDRLQLQFDGTDWNQLSRSNN